jgi:hypothetical protein
MILVDSDSRECGAGIRSIKQSVAVIVAALLVADNLEWLGPQFLRVETAFPQKLRLTPLLVSPGWFLGQTS